MTTIGATRDDPAALRPDGPLIRPEIWVRIGLIALAFGVLFYDILYRLVRFAWDEADWSHAFVVPLISLYFVYQQRHRLRGMTARTSWFGLVVLLAGIGFYCMGIYPIRNDMVKGYAMILALGGLVLYMTGWQMARILWFPVAYLVFAVKVSDKIWGLLAFHLQGIAAKCATVALNVVGLLIDLEAHVSGHHITLWKDGVELEPPLTVAEACSGLSSLMMFIALGVAIAYLARRPWWARLILVVSTVPVAIAANVMRVTTLGLIYPYNRELTRGDAHQMIGLIMLVAVAAVMFLVIGWVMDRLVVYDEPENAGNESDTAAASEGQNA